VQGQFPHGQSGDHLIGVSHRLTTAATEFVSLNHGVRTFCVHNSLRADSQSPACPAKVPMPKSSDPWSIVVIALTIALFILALFVKGFTKGLLVECGVLLVSIKLILMAKKTAEIEQNLALRLDRIEKLLSNGRVEKSS
jgi:hypothetical protein